MKYRIAALLIALSTILPALSARAQSVCPDNFVAFADTTETLTCTCTSEATDRGSVWGMDVYTGDSAICRAARHAGIITKKGGTVNVVPEPGRSAYPGVTRNGVESINYAAFASSFRFAGATGTAVPGAASSVNPSSASAAAAASVCPDNFLAFADTTEPLTCTCAPDATDRGSVWGMDVYTGDSGVCKAARHAGVIPKSGGTVSVIPEPGKSAYAGVTRNGVASNNYGAFASSFRFAKTDAAGTAQPASSAAPASTQVSVCPDNFVAFADSGETLACICQPEAMDRGSVWGMDVYTGDSGVCKAAKHAGVIGAKGGTVSVISEPGRKAYAGVTRNGVASNNYGPFASSFRFAAKEPPPAPVAAPAPAAAPVQQPIAATLRERGEVALYIRFRTGSADLDPATVSVLEELLAALKADNALNLGLIGHTDAVGGRDANKTLSYRRAEAVRFWLADHGISAVRIAVDGRGFDEPLADNATEQGRALNRRVQAKKM